MTTCSGSSRRRAGEDPFGYRSELVQLVRLASSARSLQGQGAGTE